MVAELPPEIWERIFFYALVRPAWCDVEGDHENDWRWAWDAAWPLALVHHPPTRTYSRLLEDPVRVEVRRTGCALAGVCRAWAETMKPYTSSSQSVDLACREPSELPSLRSDVRHLELCCIKSDMDNTLARIHAWTHVAPNGHAITSLALDQSTSYILKAFVDRLPRGNEQLRSLAFTVTPANPATDLSSTVCPTIAKLVNLRDLRMNGELHWFDGADFLRAAAELPELEHLQVCTGDGANAARIVPSEGFRLKTTKLRHLELVELENVADQVCITLAHQHAATLEFLLIKSPEADGTVRNWRTDSVAYVDPMPENIAWPKLEYLEIEYPAGVHGGLHTTGTGRRESCVMDLLERAPLLEAVLLRNVSFRGDEGDAASGDGAMTATTIERLAKRIAQGSITKLLVEEDSDGQPEALLDLAMSWRQRPGWDRANLDARFLFPDVTQM